MLNSHRFRTTKKGGSVSIHMRNIQSLVIEMFRVSRKILPPIMNDIFKQKDKQQSV